MTFSTNVPNAGQSPGVFPAQNNTNFTRLQTIITADHVFNDTAAANDGYHEQVTLVNRTDPAGANPIFYSKLVSATSTPYFWDGAFARPLAYGGFPQILASVNFNGTVTGVPNIAQTIRGTAFNVASVTRVGTSTGRYLITFTNALPDTNYIVQVTGMRNTSGDVSNGCVAGSATYGDSVKVGSINVDFFGSSTSEQNVLMGNVIVWRYTP